MIEAAALPANSSGCFERRRSMLDLHPRARGYGTVFQDTPATSRAAVDSWQSLIVEDEYTVRKAWKRRSAGGAERPL
jgi:hypothetical protein